MLAKRSGLFVLFGISTALVAVACSSSDDASTAPSTTADGGAGSDAQVSGPRSPDGGDEEGSDGGDGGDAGPAKVVELAPGTDFTCARFGDGTVKCWGSGAAGQLGQGDMETIRGDLAAVPAIDLGAGRRAIAVSAGNRHACAVLEGGGVKCWGINAEGALGLGDTVYRGDNADEMGDALPFVDLGPNAKAVQISVGRHSCAVLDDGRVKCWGENSRGELGLGDTASRGDEPNEMGANLPAVDLGPGRKAVAVAAGFYTTCAVLDDGSLKCWGGNASGQLGLGDTASRGDEPGELGAALPAVSLGAGRTAKQVWVGVGSVCAVLDEGSLKCWGAKLGRYGVVAENVGDAAGEMAALAPVALGTGRKVVALAPGMALHACAVLDDATLKCWGYDSQGQLGLGDTTDRATAAQLGDALPAVSLGTGRSAVRAAIGGEHSCAQLDDGHVKCWGANASGQLGLGDSASRGDGPGEMGDALPALGL